MKTFVFLVCLLCAQVVMSHPNVENINLVVRAIREILVKYFVKNSPKMTLFICGVPGGSAQSIAQKLLQNLPLGITLELINNKDGFGTSSSTVFLLDSLPLDEDELSLGDIKFFDDRGVWHKHLFYCPGMSTEDVANAFVSSKVISEVNFLVNLESSSVELVSNFLFTPNYCDMDLMQTVNRFTYDTGRWAWENSNFYPNKYQNFHDCLIEVTYSNDYTNKIGKYIFETLAKQLNFDLKRQHVDTRDFHKNRNEVMNEYISLQSEHTNAMSLSSAIFFDALTFVVPPGKPLSDLEKMFAVFDTETWIGIGATFAIAIVVILIVKCMPKMVQNFVFGMWIKTPILNLFDIFINGGQNRVPGRNFARYMLTMFTLWSLIFRTCYQSGTFENMNTDMRNKRIRTIEELKDANFTLILYKGFADWARLYSAR